MGAEPSAQLPAMHTSSTTHPPVRCKQNATYCWAFGTWGALHKHSLNKKEEKKTVISRAHPPSHLNIRAGNPVLCLALSISRLAAGSGHPRSWAVPILPQWHPLHIEKPNAIFLDHAGHGRTALSPSTKPHHSTEESSIKKNPFPLAQGQANPGRTQTSAVLQGEKGSLSGRSCL